MSVCAVTRGGRGRSIVRCMLETPLEKWAFSSNLRKSWGIGGNSSLPLFMTCCYWVGQFWGRPCGPHFWRVPCIVCEPNCQCGSNLSGLHLSYFVVPKETIWVKPLPRLLIDNLVRLALDWQFRVSVWGAFCPRFPAFRKITRKSSSLADNAHARLTCWIYQRS